MQTQQITMERARAVELFHAYKKHLHWSAPIDKEIMRTYEFLAQGRVIIKAIESIAAAGLNDDGFPKLALARADAQACQFHQSYDGRARMADNANNLHTNRRSPGAFDFPEGTFPVTTRRRGYFHRATAQVPLIPLHVRPKRGLANYHILWEAEWEKAVPKDPFLLRRIGEADLWLVVAAWDLTPVEQAALATRIRA
jgi:hypothetical protein